MATGIARLSRHHKLLIAVALLFGGAALSSPPARAGGVVGNGTAISCTTAAYAGAMAGGGDVTFYCGADPLTVVVNTQVINTGETTVVDGGGLITLDGENLRQLFLVMNGGSLTLRNIVLTRGSFPGGGAIRNETGGTVVLDQVTIRECASPGGSGGAISNSGTLTIDRSTLKNNSASFSGGAVYNVGAGTVLVKDSTISDNGAMVVGGGIYQQNGGPTVLERVTFSGNQAQAGGGLAHFGVLTATNVTFAANVAQTGGGLYAGTFATWNALINVTMNVNRADTGGAIYNESVHITLKNTIVANSRDRLDTSASLNCVNNGNPITSLGFNVIGDNSCIAPSVGDQTNTDPLLGPLVDNGGPTLTFMPQSGSPAINTGTNTGCPATDQRGASRPFGPTCDVGAVEYGAGWPSLWLPVVTRS